LLLEYQLTGDRSAQVEMEPQDISYDVQAAEETWKMGDQQHLNFDDLLNVVKVEYDDSPTGSVEKVSYVEMYHVKPESNDEMNDFASISSSLSYDDSKQLGGGLFNCSAVASQEQLSLQQQQEQQEQEQQQQQQHLHKWTCGICGIISNTTVAFKHHARTHTDVYPKCPQCGKTLSNRSNLTRHMKIHLGVKNQVCDICKKAFLSKDHLYQHQKVHSAIKEYVCHTCGDDFHQHSNLIHHMRIHSSVKEYTCNMCGKAFSQQRGLAQHLKTHSNVKEHVCHVCHSRFSHQQGLARHLKVHSNVKEFSCEICGKEFNRRCNLMRHKKLHGNNATQYKHESFNGGIST